MLNKIHPVSVPRKIFVKTSKSSDKLLVKRKLTLDDKTEVEYESAPQYAGRPFYFTLRVIGACPFTIDDSGEASFKLLSSSMAYSIVVYLLLSTAICYEISVRYKVVFYSISSGIDAYISTMVYILLNLSYVFMPLVLWLPVKALVRNHNEWLKFQNTFERTTGHRMQCKLYPITKKLALLIPIFCLSYTSGWAFLNTPKEPWLIFVYALPLVGGFAFDGLWCTSVVRLGQTAQQLNERLKTQFTRYAEVADMQECLVREYRSLWSDMARTLQQNNDVSTLTFSFRITHLFIMLTLTLYLFLSGLRKNWDTEQGMLLATALIYIFEMWVMANAAHFTVTKFDAIQWDPFWLITPALMPMSLQNEITTFLKVASTSPRVVDIGGFVTINRSWLVNMLGNLMSSLIILLQFRVSQTDGGPNIGGNATIAPSR